MSEYFERKFREHRVHDALTSAILESENELRATKDDSAKAIFRNFIDIFKSLQQSIKYLDPEIAVRSHILGEIRSVASFNIRDFEFYKAEKNITDLVKAEKKVYKNLSILLERVNRSNNENIINSLKETFRLAEGIEPIKIETTLENHNFSTKLEEQEKKIRQLIGKTEERANAANEELNRILQVFNTQVSKYGKEAEAEHERTKRIQGIIAGDELSAPYEEIAKKEEKQAEFWRILSAFFIVCLVATVMLSAKFSVTYDTNLLFVGGIIKTFSIAAAFIYGSAFSIRQSNQHRKNSNRAKWLAKGVDAVGAFTELLNPEDKSTARFKVIDVILSQQESEGKVESKTSGRNEIMEQLERIVDFVKPKS